MKLSSNLKKIFSIKIGEKKHCCFDFTVSSKFPPIQIMQTLEVGAIPHPLSSLPSQFPAPRPQDAASGWMWRRCAINSGAHGLGAIAESNTTHYKSLSCPNAAVSLPPLHGGDFLVSEEKFTEFPNHLLRNGWVLEDVSLCQSPHDHRPFSPGNSGGCCCYRPSLWPGPGGTSADQWLSWNRPWESPREATALENHPRIPLKCFARVHWARKVLGFMLFYPFLFFGWAFQLEMWNTKAIPGHSLQTCHETPLWLITRGSGLGLLSPALQMPGTLKTMTERDPGPRKQGLGPRPRSFPPGPKSSCSDWGI